MHKKLPVVHVVVVVVVVLVVVVIVVVVVEIVVVVVVVEVVVVGVVVVVLVEVLVVVVVLMVVVVEVIVVVVVIGGKGATHLAVHCAPAPVVFSSEVKTTFRSSVVTCLTNLYQQYLKKKIHKIIDPVKTKNLHSYTLTL